jgi:hypothetical protein
MRYILLYHISTLQAFVCLPAGVSEDRQQDKEVGHVGKGQELGVLFEGAAKLQKDDVLDMYVIERKKV